MPQVANHLGWAIAALVLAFWPTGIVAVVFASQVDNKLIMGDYEGAIRSSKRAKLWSWISLGAGIVSWILYFLWSVFWVSYTGDYSTY